MVSAQEVKQQIAQREQQFQQARQQLAQAPTRIDISRRQLLQVGRGIASRVQIQKAEQQRRKQISQAKQELTKQEKTFKKQVAPVQKQIKAYESAVANQQREASEWAQAKQLIRSGRAGQRVSGGVRRKIDDIQAGMANIAEQQAAFAAATEVTFKGIGQEAIKLDLGQIQAPQISTTLDLGGKVFRTAEGVLVGKGFLRPTRENIDKYGGIVGGPLTEIGGEIIPSLVAPDFKPFKFERIREIFDERRYTPLGITSGVITTLREFPPEDVTKFPSLQDIKTSRDVALRVRMAREADLEKARGEPGFVKPEFREKFIKGAEIGAAALGISAAPFIAPTVLAAPFVKEGVEDIPRVIEKIGEFAPEREDIQGFPTLEYLPPERQDGLTKWFAPTQEVPTYEFTYKDIERGEPGFVKPEFEEVFFKGARVGAAALGISAAPFIAPTVLAAPVVMPLAEKIATAIVNASPELKEKGPGAINQAILDLQKQIEEKKIPKSMNVIKKDIEQAKKTEEKLEQEAKIIIRQVSDLGAETDPEKQATAIKSLEEKGVKITEVVDPETGVVTLAVSNPEWFENLRPGFENKKVKETMTSFFLRKLKKGISEEIEDIYQRRVFKGPGIGQPFLERAKGVPVTPVTISPEAALVGKGVATGAELAAFAIPGIQQAMFFGGPAEVALRSPGEFFKFAKEEPLEVGLAALGGGVAAFKGVKFIRKPIVTKLPVKETILRGEDIIQPIVVGEEVIERGIFAQVGFAPARKALVTTRLEKFLGRPPKIVTIAKPQLRLAFPRAPITIRAGKIVEPAQFITTRVGKAPSKSVLFFGLSGESTPTTLTQFSKLPAWKQRQWQMTVEKALGRPIPRKFTPKFLKEGLIKTEASVAGKKLFRLTVSRKAGEDIVKVTTPELGRTITRQELVIIAEKMPLGEQEKIQLFKTLTGIKDVTKPFPRAAGKIPTVSGKTIILPTVEAPGPIVTFRPTPPPTRLAQEALKIEEATQILKQTKETKKLLDIARKAKLTKLPPAPDIIPPLEIVPSPRAAIPPTSVFPLEPQVLEPTTKVIPKVSQESIGLLQAARAEAAAKIAEQLARQRITLPKQIPSPAIVEVPGAVPGVTKASAFFGPQFAPPEETLIIPIERTGSPISGVRPIIEIRTDLGVTPIFLEQPDIKVIDQTKIKIGITEVQIPKIRTKTGQVQIPKSIQIPASIQVPSLIQTPGQIQVPRMTQAQRLAQAAQLVQTPRVITTPRIIPGAPPKVPTKPTGFLFPTGSQIVTPKVKVPRKRRKEKVVFTPEVKRKGKWVALGKFKKAKRAAAFGKQEALDTAVASVRLKSNGKIIPLEPSKLFRKSKSDPGVIVQKKTKRIQSPGEKAEISLIGSRAAKARRVRVSKSKTIFKIKPTKIVKPAKKKKSSRPKKPKKVKKKTKSKKRKKK